MNTVRTTISLEADLHRQVLAQANNLGLSMSEVVNKRLMNPNFGKSRAQIEEKIAEDRRFFRQLSHKGRKVDLVKALREYRDRDS